jgi:hypothetical protein
MLFNDVNAWLLILSGFEEIKSMNKSWHAICFAMTVNAISLDAATLQQTNAQSVSLSPTGGRAGLTTIVELTVPPGNWVVNSKASVVNFGANDFVRCSLLAEDPWHQFYPSDSSTVTSGGEVGAASVVTIVNQAAISKSGPRHL